MDRWRGKVAIVTGASAGIGASIAQNLVNAGIRVVGLARRADKLQDLARKLNAKGNLFYPKPCDVSKEEEILKVFEEVESSYGPVDILVNNAAVTCNDPIIECSSENYRKILDLNVLAVAICTREAVKSMRKHNVQGHIININSVAGHLADMISIPLSLYCASKYAVTGMTASLRNELNAARTKIKITSISPGAVRTDMILSVGLPKEVLEKIPALEPRDVADAVMYALGTPPHVQIAELTITPVEQQINVGNAR